jgi:hypothetical protein
VHVSDQEVIELRVEAPAGAGKAGAAAFVWTGLTQQRLLHPERADLAGLQRTRDRLLALGADRRMKRVED